VEQLQVEMSDLSTGVRGTVRIAASIAVITQYLPQQLRAFAVRHPGIVIELADSLSPHAIQLVAEGRADIGIFGDPFVAAGLRTLPYSEETLVAVLPLGHELLVRRSVTLADMLPYDFVCLRDESSLNTLLMKAAAQLGQPIKRRVQVSGNEAVCWRWAWASACCHRAGSTATPPSPGWPPARSTNCGRGGACNCASRTTTIPSTCPPSCWWST
jgi:DNA-binding transcriptional LysR family regulator